MDSMQTSTLTKAQIMELLCKQIGMNRRDSKDMADAFFDLIFASVARGEDVKISGFGNFMLSTKNQREGRNPRTGEQATIAARTVLTFRACNGLKAQINDATSITQRQI